MGFLIRQGMGVQGRGFIRLAGHAWRDGRKNAIAVSLIDEWTR